MSERYPLLTFLCTNKLLHVNSIHEEFVYVVDSEITVK